MKYMLAVDGYTMSNGDGFNSQAYFLENNTLGVLKDKKDGVKVIRIDGKMVLAKNVNIDFVGKVDKDEVKD